MQSEQVNTSSKDMVYDNGNSALSIGDNGKVSPNPNNQVALLGKKRKKCLKLKRIKKKKVEVTIDFRGCFLDLPEVCSKFDPDIYTNKQKFIDSLSDLLMGGHFGQVNKLVRKEFIRRGQLLFNRFKVEYNARDLFDDATMGNSLDSVALQRQCIEEPLNKIFTQYEKSYSNDEYVTEYNNKNFYKASEVIVTDKEIKQMAKENNVSIEYKFVTEVAYSQSLEKAKILITKDDILLTEDEETLQKRQYFNISNMQKIDYQKFRTSVKAYIIKDYIFEHYVSMKIQGDEKIPIDIETTFPTEPKIKKTCPTSNVMCVGLLEPNIYTLNKGVHIPFSGNFKENDNVWAYVFKKHIEETYNVKVKFVVVGHEHGTIKKHCHLQVSMLLEVKTQILFMPGFIHIRHRYSEEIGFKVLFLFTKCKNSKLNALYYAKKEKDFQQIGYINNEFEFCYEVAYINQNGKEYVCKKLDIQKTLYINKDKNFTDDQVISYLVEGKVNLVYFNINNIKELYNTIKKGLTNVEAVHLPLEGYLLDDECGPKYVNQQGVVEYHIGKAINKWYIENVKEFQVINNDYRRRALCICGDRGIGKTFLINQFVSDKRFIKRICGSIPERFMYNGEKLLVLDDFPFEFYTKNVELLKSLLSSQECTINSKYNACVWPNGIPVVILTNDIKVLRYMSCSENFRRCVDTIYCGNVYLGPPNTKDTAYTKVNALHTLPLDMQKAFDREWMDIKNRKRKKSYMEISDSDSESNKEKLNVNNISSISIYKPKRKLISMKKPSVDMKKIDNMVFDNNGNIQVNQEYKDENDKKVKLK